MPIVNNRPYNGLLAGLCLMLFFFSALGLARPGMAADTQPPVISLVKALPAITSDTTPRFTIASTESGLIYLGGSCTTLRRYIQAGTSTITLEPLSEGRYSDCHVKVADGQGNLSEVLTLPSFVVMPPATNPDQDCLAGDKPVSALGIELVNAFPRLPVIPGLIQIYRKPGDSTYWYGTLRTGKIIRFVDSPDTNAFVVLADISARVESGYGEQGLLGLACHPQFATNRKLYLYYTLKEVSDNNDTVLAEFDFDNDVLANEVVLWRFVKGSQIHQGGHLAFGPDGKLYLGIGDDGVSRYAQDVSLPHGKLLRLTVPGNGTYSIPQDNPVAKNGVTTATYAYGLRNPWRWSFDSLTDELWLADVGWNSYEEINRIVPGGNYGWPYREGELCLQAGCDSQPGLLPPLYSYSHDVGSVVIGGVVYRGTSFPELYGQYLFADGALPQLWALSNNQQVTTLFSGSLGGIGGFHSLTEDPVTGEVYINHNNFIFRLARSTQGASVPATLSATGCYTTSNGALHAGSSLQPYDVRSPLYSDGLSKRRWVSLPDGQSATLDSSGDIRFPVGTVLVKQFNWKGRKIETRLLKKYNDGSWGGHAYLWNAAETEANLVASGTQVDLDGMTYQVPSSTQCLQCHNESVDFAIGPTQVQLDMPVPIPGGQYNQLQRWRYKGLVTGDKIATRTIVDHRHPGNRPHKRIRSFLYSNCAFCHNPAGPGRGAVDFSLNAPTPWYTCNIFPQVGNLGVEGATILDSADPAKSILYLRLTTTEAHRMPPLGRTTVYEGMKTLLGQYIENTGCSLPP